MHFAARLAALIRGNARADAGLYVGETRIKRGPMPKTKTNSGAKKRFVRMTSGRIKRAKAFKSHLLTKKSRKRKRALGKKTRVDARDQARMRRLLDG